MAINTFFQDSNELGGRLTDFENAYHYGQSLFHEREDSTAHSRDVALVYLSYAALMSKETGDFVYSSDNPQGHRVEYKNPKDILDQMNNSSIFIDHTLKSNLLILPVLSKSGHLTLEQINECYSRGIAVIGIPYGSHDQNTFDAETGASPLDFAIHDLQHAGQYLFPGNAYAFSDQKSRDYAPQRRVIYDAMKKDDLTHTFATPYFMTFHEHGMTAPLNARLTPLNSNPIQNTINFINDFYMAADNQRDHILKSILQNNQGFFKILFEEIDFIGSRRMIFASTPKIPTGIDDIILNEEDITKPFDFRYDIHFTLNSQPNETFLLHSVSYNQMMETGIDLAKLLNSYGANIAISDDTTQFNVHHFLDNMLEGLNQFNAAYGHLFETA